MPTKCWAERDTRATVLNSMDEELALWSFHFTKNRRNKCIVQIGRGVLNENPLRGVVTGPLTAEGSRRVSLKDALK